MSQPGGRFQCWISSVTLPAMPIPSGKESSLVTSGTALFAPDDGTDGKCQVCELRGVSEAESASERSPRLRQPGNTLFDGRGLLGEAEPHDIGDRRLGVKGRERNRRDAAFRHGAGAETHIVEADARRGEVDVE